MFCTACGSEVGERDTVCMACGSRTSNSPSAYVAAGAKGTLKPLGIGERLDATLKAYFANFKPNARALAMLAIPFSVVVGIIQISTQLDPNAVQVNSSTGVTNFNASALWTFAAGSLAVFLLGGVIAAWSSATVMQIVGGSLVGSPVEWRVALRRAGRRLPSILWILALYLVALFGPALAVAGVSLALAAAHLGGLAITVGVLGSFAWIVYAVWFYTKQSLSVTSLMLEDVRGVRAIRRSMALIKGSWWSVAVTLLVAGVLSAILTGIVGLVFGLLAVVSRNSSPLHFLVICVQEFVVLVVFTPFTATLLAVLSIDMRVRKEGLDIEILANQLDAIPLTPPPASAEGSSSSFPSLSFPPPPPPSGE